MDVIKIRNVFGDFEKTHQNETKEKKITGKNIYNPHSKDNLNTKINKWKMREIKNFVILPIQFEINQGIKH